MAKRDRSLLVVDDEERNRRLIGAILSKNGYIFDTAADGMEALKKATSLLPDLIYLDLMMPGMDGFEVSRRLKEDPRTRNIPIIMVTVITDRESKIRALESGVSDFLTKPVDQIELIVRTKNLLKVKEFEDFLREHNELLEVEVKKRTSELQLALKELSRSNRDLEESRHRIREGYIDTVQRLTIVSEFKDKDTALHIKRVSHYCACLAKALGWDGDRIDTIFYASPMHDIGKVGIPTDILLKPGSLNTEEFALMKTHTLIGGRILDGSASEILTMAQSIALTHHERWDGRGYPYSLRGEDIPDEGCIMNIVDQYDSLRSKRPYKPGLPHADAFRIITEGDGRTMPSHFNPRVLDVFKDMNLEFDKIFETHSAGADAHFS